MKETKKSETTREKDRKRKYLTKKKREKTIKKKNNNKADLANRVSVWQSNFDFSEKKTLYLDFNETLTKNI